MVHDSIYCFYHGLTCISLSVYYDEVCFLSSFFFFFFFIYNKTKIPVCYCEKLKLFHCDYSFLKKYLDLNHIYPGQLFFLSSY